MNRREFTTRFSALATVPFLPFPVSATAMAAPSAPVPAGAYAWAKLIAQAQNRCAPGMLARQLHLAPEAAEQLFAKLIHDGVLRAPGAAGIARAAAPIDGSGTASGLNRQLADSLRIMLDRAVPAEAPDDDDTNPLVKDTPACLGCANTPTEDAANASPNEYVQDRPPLR